jgi:hypothetical protein
MHIATIGKAVSIVGITILTKSEIVSKLQDDSCFGEGED